MFKLKRTSFITDRLEIKNNHIKPGNFKLNPKITRRTGKIKDTVFFTSLTLDIQSTETHPFPVNIFIQFKGIFEFAEIDNDQEITKFLKGEAVSIMYPYLRSMVSNLSTSAMLPPIVLPIIDTKKLFKENTDFSDSILIN